jgi:glutaredoxin-like YruB-family protein
MKIKVYSTPTCPYCKLVKDYLKEQTIAFTEMDVSQDNDAIQKMVKLSGQMGVPVIDINGQIIVGWNKNALEEVIKVQQQKDTEGSPKQKA